MIKIDVYSMLGSTVCAVDWYRDPSAIATSAHSASENLAHVAADRLAHDEQQQLLDLVAEALEAAFERAAERGGWSAIV